MATESPLISDGSETVAAANYWNPASALAGPSGSGQFLAVALSTAVARTSVLASVLGQQIYGVLQNKPNIGEAADVGLFGISKMVVGSAGVTFGAAIMVDATGAAINWTAGSAYSQIGRSLETIASGGIATVFLSGTSAKVLT